MFTRAIGVKPGATLKAGCAKLGGRSGVEDQMDLNGQSRGRVMKTALGEGIGWTQREVRAGEGTDRGAREGDCREGVECSTEGHKGNEDWTTDKW